MFDGRALWGCWNGVGSGIGAGLMPVGDAIEVGTRKSSRFIGSALCSAEWSTDLRSCAIPLGADVGSFRACFFFALSTVSS